MTEKVPDQQAAEIRVMAGWVVLSLYSLGALGVLLFDEYQRAEGQPSAAGVVNAAKYGITMTLIAAWFVLRGAKVVAGMVAEYTKSRIAVEAGGCVGAILGATVGYYVFLLVMFIPGIGWMFF